MHANDLALGPTDYQQLLQAIAEELKLPLLQIARQAELGNLTDKPESALESLRVIEHNADSALRLLDTYLLGLQLYSNQQVLPLEPVSLGSVLDEAAHQLATTARQNNIELDLVISMRQGLVMGHARALQAAFLSLGSSLLANQPQSDSRHTLLLATYPRKDRMVAGVYGDQAAITPKAWQRARQLYGWSRQPLTSLTANGSAGIFVADTILRAMTANLEPAHYRRHRGLATSLPLSRQLQLV